MTKDPKFAEGKGTPAKKSGPASKVQVKVQVKSQTKGAAQSPATSPAKEQSSTTAPIVEKVAALAAVAVLTLPQAVALSPVTAQSPGGWPASPAVPLLPNETLKAAGQEGTLIIRMERTVTVLGIGDGHTVFKDAEGVVFHIDPATGDKRTLDADYFVQPSDGKGARHAVKLKFTNVLIVSILGTDAQGNTVMRNARHETFTLDPRTGAKVLIKWPK